MRLIIVLIVFLIYQVSNGLPHESKSCKFQFIYGQRVTLAKCNDDDNKEEFHD